NGIKAQLGRFLDFSEGKALILDNADWLTRLNYIEFLREVGVHFSVNRMLTADCYKGRMEKGLSFIEFNYMLLQSYDFLELHRTHGCKLQMGGDDQWSNILSGADLVRRVERAPAFGLTFPLLVTSSGGKMGKTEAGAVWLDAERTSPFDFYQYWRNTHDLDVGRFLAIFTFLPMDEVLKLGALTDREINEAKKILAFEVTKLVHGEEEATKAQAAAEALFGGSGEAEAVPTATFDAKFLNSGINIVDLMVAVGFAGSKGEARRLIRGGGLYLNDVRVETGDQAVTTADIVDGRMQLRKGKKQHLYVHVK
ncbi:MAG TPA: tyrosine--tRNA ligase, partial [Bacillota bacterium]|nr:tyrosine--tRNA ligase [Bacillota bacterium]